MNIDVTFPGELKVDARIGGHTVHTDQREKHGGGDSAPPPFDLFLASIATCMGFYALRFCQQREIDTSDLRLSMETERDPEARMVRTIRIHLELPDRFPVKYVRAIERSIDQCSVKKHMVEPPRFEVHSAFATNEPVPTISRPGSGNGDAV